MKCEVCGCEFEGVRCPACGFPVIQMVASSEAERRKRAELADNYRKEKMRNVCVSLKVYSNEMDGDKVKVKEESVITLASGEKLCGDAIVWYPENFARLSGAPILKVLVTDIRGEKKECTVPVRNPEIEDFWKVGVKAEAGLSCRIVLGNPEKYSSSDPVRLS